MNGYELIVSCKIIYPFLELFTSITGIVKTWSVSLHNLVRASYFDIHPYQLIMHKVVPYTGRKGRWWEELGIWEGWREAKDKNMIRHYMSMTLKIMIYYYNS